MTPTVQRANKKRRFHSNLMAVLMLVTAINFYFIDPRLGFVFGMLNGAMFGFDRAMNRIMYRNDLELEQNIIMAIRTIGWDKYRLEMAKWDEEYENRKNPTDRFFGTRFGNYVRDIANDVKAQMDENEQPDKA